MLELNQCYNMDCMEGMAQFPDGFFDLAVVDPPYFSGPERRGYYGSKVSKIGVYRDYPVSPAWEIPGRAYFDELRRVSKHYIVWGCNYFNYEFAPGRIVWDKCKKGTSFSDCELAATDIFNTVRLFRFMWNGMLQGKSESYCVVIHADDSGIWLGTRLALYNATELPYMEGKEQVGAVLDIDSKAWEKMFFDEKYAETAGADFGVNLTDADPLEQEARRVPLEMFYKGMGLVGLTRKHPEPVHQKDGPGKG